MRRLFSNRGSVLPLTLSLLVALSSLLTVVAAASRLAAARVEANALAHSLAVSAAAAALSGRPACESVTTFDLIKCIDNGDEVSVTISLPLRGFLVDSVLGESRVGYGVGD